MSMRHWRRTGRTIATGAAIATAFALVACTGSTPPDDALTPPPPTETATQDLAGRRRSAARPRGSSSSWPSLVRLTGVARLEMGSNCTGTVIDTGVEDGPPT